MLGNHNRAPAIVSFFVAAMTIPFASGAEQHRKPAAPAAAASPAAGDDAVDAVARYCAVAGVSASEQRVRAQIVRLESLRAALDQRIGDLESREASTRAWIDQREAALRKAGDDVIAIYGKMRPEAAAAQLSEMEEEFAAAILAKMNPRAAGTILNDMTPAFAAKIVAAIANSRRADGKKS